MAERQRPCGEPARCRGSALYAAVAWLDTRRPDRPPICRGEPSRLPVGSPSMTCPSCWRRTPAGRAAPGAIIAHWCSHGSVGRHVVAASASNSTRSCWRGHWNTTRPGYCCSSPATGFGTNGSGAHRWTRCLVGLRLPATGQGRRHSHRLTPLLDSPRRARLDALLRLRTLLARAHGDEAAYRDFRDRYRAMATSLGFEGI